MILLFIYLDLSISAFATAYYLKSKADDGWDKESILMMVGLTIFSPLFWIACACFWLYDMQETKIRKKVGLIIRNWERTSRDSAPVDSKIWSDWGFYNKDSEERFTAMRESIKTLTDEEVELLAIVRKQTFDISEATRAAILDELLERKIVNT